MESHYHQHQETPSCWSSLAAQQLRIQYCHFCGLSSIPGLENSTCCKDSQEKRKRKKERKEGRKEGKRKEKRKKKSGRKFPVVLEA